MIAREAIVGVVLAGGASRRMGGAPKALIEFEGTTLLDRAVGKLRPQVGSLIANANDDFGGIDVPTVADAFTDRRGPLAGSLAGMEWARAYEPAATHVASVAVDTPFFPSDLVARLASGETGIAMARTGRHWQPTFGLWPISLCDELRTFLTADGSRKVLVFAEPRGLRGVEFDERDFENVNTPGDLAALHGRIEA